METLTIIMIVFMALNVIAMVGAFIALIRVARKYADKIKRINEFEDSIADTIDNIDEIYEMVWDMKSDLQKGYRLGNIMSQAFVKPQLDNLVNVTPEFEKMADVINETMDWFGHYQTLEDTRMIKDLKTAFDKYVNGEEA